MSAEESLALGGPLPPPSWRVRIGNALYEKAMWPPDQVNYYLDQLLAEHAHGLAEKQRAALAANPGILEHELIDLIDPQKEGQ